MDIKTIEEGKSTAITSYILVVGVLIAMSMNSEKRNAFASYHIRQALGLSILFVAIGYTLSGFSADAPEILLPFWLCMTVLWGYGLYTAISGQMRPMPIIGTLCQKVFKTIGA
ncbi:hypothetical protein AM493_03300 [Flavobacterium akiainvivens]|uniref:Import component protein n=1 Tax=Flavobacterium akiainvivens TaxID=1202724 RepID=A0A0M8MFH8_9FLAO|nr:hypothetical protein [Flavobacterium akiainvivens]KOS05171.1 hypothetical protein AM493_03300 [Flavobacterium akiainvivens]SFQ50956.1 hypothetical protein SAMN05444144_106144 [Flavobacterium akiainvivens]